MPKRGGGTRKQRRNEQLGGRQLLESAQTNSKSKRLSTQKGLIHETVLLAKKMLRENYPLGGAPRMIMKYRRWRGGEMGEWPKVQRVLRAKTLKYSNHIQITK